MSYRKIAAISARTPPAPRLPVGHDSDASQLLDEANMLWRSISILMDTLLYHDYHHRLAGDHDSKPWQLWQRLRVLNIRVKTRCDRRREKWLASRPKVQP